MWGFVDCTRFFVSLGRPKVVLYKASLLVGTREKVALLVKPGEGKSTLMRLLAGVELPDSGTVLRDDGGWPLGYSGGFQTELSGEKNVLGMARIAGIDPARLLTFCRDFAGIGESFYEPMKYYSGTMKGRLAFAISFGVSAKTYLADDKLSVGDPVFREKCLATLRDRLTSSGLIFVTSNVRSAKGICDRYYIVSDGKFVPTANYDDAEQRFGSMFGGNEFDIELDGDEIPSFDWA